MITKTLLMLLAAVSASAAGLERLDAKLSDPGYEDRQSLLITFSRSACSTEGVYVIVRCPAYEIRLHGDGLMLYKGYTGVKTQATRTDLIPDESIKKLLLEFKRSGFLAMKDGYEKAPDAERTVSGDVVAFMRPSVTIGLRLDGAQKTVHHYTGDKSAPKSLLKLEEAIDAILDTARWTK